ncbi:MAG TPA: zf-HC2 domain-containing protein [Bacteroidota bacterium]|nr:zf-HC2 domain-containing protein [Bacteroidota bacterium]
MSVHKRINLLLYDYLKNEISDIERIAIEKHLETCRQCKNDAEEIRAAIQLFLQQNIVPSEERPAEYWQRFAGAVDERLKPQSSSAATFWSDIWDDIISFVMIRPVTVSAVSSVMVLLVVAILLWQRIIPSRVHEGENHVSQAADISGQTIEQNIRMGDYFRKSKMLLVGITNMKLNENQQIDLRDERKYSRALLQEARYLKNQPMDNRSAKLIGDLEKILIQLANAKDRGDAPDVEIIRGGIHQQNLLFKIRIAESVFDSSRVSGY